jgi:hypothetical protein
LTNSTTSRSKQVQDRRLGVEHVLSTGGCGHTFARRCKLADTKCGREWAFESGFHLSRLDHRMDSISTPLKRSSIEAYQSTW